MKIFTSDNLAELESLKKGQYVELLPGTYKGHCGNIESIYFEEEVFGFLEPIIEHNFPPYSHYAFTEIPKSAWSKIIAEFSKLSEGINTFTDEQIRKNVGFIFKNSEQNFFENLDKNRIDLKILIDELVNWLGEQINQHESITVLGI